VRKILVLGATGLIGGRLIHWLGQKGVVVRAGTRREQGNLPLGQSWAVYSWNQPKSLERLCEGMDAVVHLASPNVGMVATRPEILREIDAGNRTLCRAMKSQGVARGVYLSSIHVYGESLRGRVTEQTPAGTIKIYGQMHARTELTLLESGMPWVVFRSANGVGWPVGPKVECWTLLANDLCRQAAQKGSAQLRSHPGTRRDFVPLGEILRALEYGARSAAPGLYLLASGKTRTTGWLAAKIAEEYGKQTGKRLAGLETLEGLTVGPEFVLEVCKLAKAGFFVSDDLGLEISRLMK